jgi:DNA-binding Xre family transcriptional regulator
VGNSPLTTGQKPTMVFEMSTADAIVSRIEKYCAKHGVAPSTFGRLAVNDGKLVTRLKQGKSITLDTLQKIEQALELKRVTS